MFKNLQIMAQEFAKTPIIGQQGEFPSRLSLRKTKKAYILHHFCIIIRFKGKETSSHLDFAKE
ncbi:MAG: hypothetical protein NG784_15820 [Candidatus Jettenia sp.]|nr:hypothetical protein [Candidatus Jettenia sp.]